MEPTEAQLEAERLIDLDIRGRAWFAGHSEPLSRESLGRRLREIDQYEQDPGRAEPAHAAWEEARDAIRALSQSGPAGGPVVEALATALGDRNRPLERRRVAAAILAECSLVGRPAETMVAALNDPDPNIQIEALTGIVRVPTTMWCDSIGRIAELVASDHPRVAKRAETKLVTLPVDARTTAQLVELLRACVQAGGRDKVISIVETLLRCRGLDPAALKAEWARGANTP